MKKIVLILFVFIINSGAYGGNLIVNAKISKIASSSDGFSDNFYLKISGGSGLCTSVGYTIFPRDRAPSQAAHDRMYAAALMAFASGKTIRVYSYGTDDCKEASFIEVNE